MRLRAALRRDAAALGRSFLRAGFAGHGPKLDHVTVEDSSRDVKDIVDQRVAEALIDDVADLARVHEVLHPQDRQLL